LLCFLQIAETSATSNTPKMISLSTLFSLETTSTTSKISLFTSQASGHFQTAFEANVVHAAQELSTQTHHSGTSRALLISASRMLTEKLSTSSSMLFPSARRSSPV